MPPAGYTFPRPAAGGHHAVPPPTRRRPQARRAPAVPRGAGRPAAPLVLAVPVAPPSADTAMRGDADEVICLEMPERFLAIGEWYEDFAQTSDEEVVVLLRAARAGPGAPAAGAGPGGDGGARAGYGLVPGALAEQADRGQGEQVRESPGDRARAPGPGAAAGGPGEGGAAARRPAEAAGA